MTNYKSNVIFMKMVFSKNICEYKLLYLFYI